MQAGTRIVRAWNAKGKMLMCDAEIEKPGARREATHLLSFEKVLEIAQHSKNAEEFIWRINRRGSTGV